jgi:ABC-type transport system involved in cytochrome c biogenesis permease subunit
LRITQAIQAASAIITGIFITFSQIHDALIGNIGLVILGAGFAISSAMLAAKNVSRITNIIKLAFYVAVIIFAIVLIAQLDQLWFFGLMFIWPFVSGFFEVGKLFTSQPGTVERKDSALNALINFGLIVAVSVSGFVSGIDPVAFVGFFGAYAIILGVHLGISSASPKQA